MKVGVYFIITVIFVSRGLLLILLLKRQETAVSIVWSKSEEISALGSICGGREMVDVITF